MNNLIRSFCACLCGLLAIGGCSITSAADDSVNAELIARGEYMTQLLGCGGCHTEGALMGWQGGEWLAGSSVGVAYTEGDHPGIVFPSNLTPHPTAGIGKFTRTEVKNLIRRGFTEGHRKLVVMPWQNYAFLRDEDVEAVAAYLLSLEPVEKYVPTPIPRGEATSEPYVRIGLYHSGTDRAH